MEPLQAQKLQPVGMALAAQQFRRALADPVGALAPQEAAVIEEEPQQVQVVVANLPTKEEVVPQAAVEVFDDRAGPGRIGHDRPNRFPQGVELTAQALAQGALALPMDRAVEVEPLQFTHLLDPAPGNLPARRQIAEALLQDAGKGEEV